MYMYIECHGFESHLRQLIFSRKSDCLGCAVFALFVCLTLLASFFLPSHLSFKNMYIHVYTQWLYRMRLECVNTVGALQLICWKLLYMSCM